VDWFTKAKGTGGVYGIGINIPGRDPTGKLWINIIPKVNKDKGIPSQATEIKPPGQTSLLANDPTKVQVVKIRDLRQTLEVKTGYGETNAWVKWMKYSVCALYKCNCYTCAAGWL
jgi:hypothetical protein